MQNAKCIMQNYSISLPYIWDCHTSVLTGSQWQTRYIFNTLYIQHLAFCIQHYLMHLQNWTLFLIPQSGFGQHWACFRSSFRLISISQLNVLPHLHPWPINDIVYVEPQWRSYLRESFTLRCLQRLSRPHVATQPCPWQNNWYTRGASIPVLSY